MDRGMDRVKELVSRYMEVSTEIIEARMRAYQNTRQMTRDLFATTTSLEVEVQMVRRMFKTVDFQESSIQTLLVEKRASIAKELAEIVAEVG